MLHLRNWKCQVCHKVFASNGVYTLHLLVCSKAAAKKISTFQGLLSSGTTKEGGREERGEDNVAPLEKTKAVGKCFSCGLHFPADNLLHHLLHCYTDNAQNGAQGSFITPNVADNAAVAYEASRNARSEDSGMYASATAKSSSTLQTDEASHFGPGVGGSRKNLQVGFGNVKDTKKRAPIVLPDCVKVVKRGASTSYACDICKRTFKTRQHVYYHAWCATPTKPKPYKCTICSSGFITKAHYEHHARGHEGDKPFTCELCHKQFSTVNKLSRHRDGVHEGLKPHVCTQCNARFARKESLEKHVKRHDEGRNIAENTRERTGDGFLCDICGRKYSAEWNLTEHIKTHMKGSQFQCTMTNCERTFTISKDLKRHTDSVHKGLKKYVCNVCGRCFARRDNLLRHARTRHGSSNDLLSRTLEGAQEGVGNSLPFEIVSCYTM